MRVDHWRHVLVLTTALTVAPFAWASTSHAQNEGTPAPEVEVGSEADETSASLDEERARRLYVIGDDHYAHGRYEEALAAFEESYALSGRPVLLYNMANAQERAGFTREAIESLESYLPHAAPRERAAVEARITSLRARADRVDELRRPPPGDEVVPDAPEESVDFKGPLLLAAGGAAIITSAVLWIRIAGIRSDFDSACNDLDGREICGESAESLEVKDRRMSISADVLLVAGVAAAGVGLYFLLTGDDDDDETDTTEVSVGATPNSIYGSISHAF